MARLPKSLIRKYGISKKAWAVFRGTKRTRKTIKTKTYTRRISMAKRKHYRKHSSSKSGGFFGKATQVLLGAGVAALYEVFISPMIPLADTIKNILELVLGLFLAMSRKMPMFVRAGGAALATINAYAFLVPLISGSGRGSSASAWSN